MVFRIVCLASGTCLDPVRPGCPHGLYSFNQSNLFSDFTYFTIRTRTAMLINNGAGPTLALDVKLWLRG